MRSVQISVDLCSYLRSATYLPADLRDMLQERLPDCGQAATWSLNADIAERFRDCFTERLAQAGFDSDYNLSSEGAVLEELIDRFAG